VYINNKGIDDVDVIFFSGKRWALMKLERSVTNNLTSFLYSFDYNLNNNSVSFLTETVNIDTPKDFSSPIYLEWYIEKNGLNTFESNSKKIQVPDFRKKSGALLLCKICDKTNPCLNDGECVHGICDCKHGATGELCQIIPLSNSECNAYYNMPHYANDGGDCCYETCIPEGDENMCGYNRSNIFQDYTVTQYIGYPKCLDPTYSCNEDTDCWNLISGADNLLKSGMGEIDYSDHDVSEIEAFEFGKQVLICLTGNLIAVRVKHQLGFLLYEEFGNTWRARDFTPKDKDSQFHQQYSLVNMFISIEASGDILNLLLEEKKNYNFNYFDNTGLKEDATYILQTHEWKLQSQVYEMINNMTFSFNSPPSRTSMSDNGKIFAVVIEERMLMYEYLHNNWVQKGLQITNMITEIQAISLSYDGNIVATRSPGNLHIYQYNISKIDWSLLGESIRVGDYSGTAISLSNDGETVAIDIWSSNTTVIQCSVFKFYASQKKWNNFGNNITLGNETYNNSTQILSLSHNGQKLAVVNSGETDSHLRMYTFNSTSKNWEDGFKYGNKRKIESLSITGDFKRAAIGQSSVSDVKLVYDTKASVRKTVPITIQAKLGSDTSNIGVLLVCDSNVYINVKLDHSVSNRTLTYTVYINEKEKCHLTVTNKLETTSRGLFIIYNGANVTTDESIIAQSSGLKFYHNSRETITFYSSPFSKAILKDLITLELVPINQEGSISKVDPIDHEDKIKYSLLCDDYYIEFITNSTTNSTFDVTLRLETGADCNINVAYNGMNGKIDYNIEHFKVPQALNYSINITPKIVSPTVVTNICIGNRNNFMTSYGDCSIYYGSNDQSCLHYNAKDACAECGKCIFVPTNSTNLCIGNRTAFKSYGDCSLYNNEFEKRYCSMDKDESTSYLAEDVCSECGRCAGNETAGSLLPQNIDYLGCFIDSKDSALPNRTGGEYNSVKECAEICKEYKYFGRQSLGECWCGDGDYGKHGEANYCDCHGENVGKLKQQCVYQYKNVSTAVSPSSSPSLSPPSTQSLSYPTIYPSTDPTVYLSIDPTVYPSSNPTVNPSADPTVLPSADPTQPSPSLSPPSPSSLSSTDPTIFPSTDPTVYPSIDPTVYQSSNPTVNPSADPTVFSR